MRCVRARARAGSTKLHARKGGVCCHSSDRRGYVLRQFKDREFAHFPDTIFMSTRAVYWCSVSRKLRFGRRDIMPKCRNALRRGSELSITASHPVGRRQGGISVFEMVFAFKVPRWAHTVPTGVGISKEPCSAIACKSRTSFSFCCTLIKTVLKHPTLEACRLCQG